MQTGYPPSECQRCRKVMYPVAGLRPRPKNSLATTIALLIGTLVSAIVYASAMIYVRWVQDIFVPTVILAPIVLIPALLPGLVIGYVATRWPRVVTVRCAACGWHDTFRVPRNRKRTTDKPLANQPTAADRNLHAALEAPSLPPTPPSVDDGGMSAGSNSWPAPVLDEQAVVEELKAWIYGAFLAGRSPEELVEELCNLGWPVEEVEVWVERGRRETRSRRP